MSAPSTAARTLWRPLQGFTLRAVLVVHRHGDRSPDKNAFLHDDCSPTPAEAEAEARAWSTALPSAELCALLDAALPVESCVPARDKVCRGGAALVGSRTLRLQLLAETLAPPPRRAWGCCKFDARRRHLSAR